MTKPKKFEIGVLGGFGLLIGGGSLLIALVGLVNTALNLHLALRVSGSKTPLPSRYDEVAGLAAAGALILVLSVFGSFVWHQFTAARGRPLVRVAIIACAVVLLALAGRGIQRLALVSTYGSMLAYYATDGDLDDVRAELKKGPDREALDEAVSRAGQYDNAAALAILLDGGADLRQLSMPEPQRTCALSGRSYAFIKAALDHGIKPDACPKSQMVVWWTVANAKSDEGASKAVALLLGAGFSPAGIPEFEKMNARQSAQQRQWPLTVAVLDAPKKAIRSPE